jgi:hypothetical protein
MSRADEVLGTAPARTFDSIRAGLIRLRRNYDADDETSQMRGFNVNQLDAARIALIDSLLSWIQPAVDEEAAAWDAIDRDLQAAKESRPRLALDQPKGWRG